jgi:hypothetical protein
MTVLLRSTIVTFSSHDEGLELVEHRQVRLVVRVGR